MDRDTWNLLAKDTATLQLILQPASLTAVRLCYKFFSKSHFPILSQNEAYVLTAWP